MGKNGTTWRLFSCFVSQHLEDSVSRCFVYQDLGHTQTPRICHTFVLSLLVFGSFLPPRCLFFMANAKLPNRPGLALLLVDLAIRRKGMQGKEDQAATHVHNAWTASGSQIATIFN